MCRDIAGSCKMLKTLLLLFGLFHIGRPQDFTTLSQNFCNIISGGTFPDNLSCPNQPIQTGNCILGSTLCDGTNDCMNIAGGTQGTDEGAGFSALECKCTTR